MNHLKLRIRSLQPELCGCKQHGWVTLHPVDHDKHIRLIIQKDLIDFLDFENDTILNHTAYLLSGFLELYHAIGCEPVAMLIHKRGIKADIRLRFSNGHTQTDIACDTLMALLVANECQLPILLTTEKTSLLSKMKEDAITPIPDIFHDTLIELRLMSDTNQNSCS